MRATPDNHWMPGADFARTTIWLLSRGTESEELIRFLGLYVKELSQGNPALSADQVYGGIWHSAALTDGVPDPKADWDGLLALLDSRWDDLRGG